MTVRYPAAAISPSCFSVGWPDVPMRLSTARQL
jgi:hypothetical protein